MADNQDIATIKTHPFRREHTRFGVNADAHAVIQSGDQQRPIILHDLSTKGARGVSRLPLCLDQEITFILNPPLVSSEFRSKGRVVWAKPLPDGRSEAGFELREFDLSRISAAVIRQNKPSEFALYSGNLKPVTPAQPAPVPQPVKPKAVSDRTYKSSVGVLVVAALAFAAFLIYSNQMSGYVRPETDPRIEGFIFDSDGQSLVYIDGQVAKEGQTVNGITIERIDEDAITLINSLGQREHIAITPSEAQ